MSKQFIDTPTTIRKNAFSVAPEELTIIGLDTNDGKGHPLFDLDVYEDVPESFVANVGALGVLAPVLVDKDEHERIVVVDGRTRVRAAREVNRLRAELGEPQILVPVFYDTTRKGKVADSNRWTSVQVSSNEIRREKSPVWKAERAKAMVDAGIEISDVANRFGVGALQVQKWLVLANASSEIREAVDADKLSADAAIKLAQVNPGLQKKALRDALSGEKTTARKIEQAAGKTLPPTKKELKAAIKRLEGVSSESAKVARLALEWAWKGGDFDALVSLLTPQIAPVEGPPVVEHNAEPAQEDDGETDSYAELDDAILSVTNPKKGMIVSKIHAALILAGHPEDMEVVSKRVNALTRAGLLTNKFPHGWKRAE